MLNLPDVVSMKPMICRRPGSEIPWNVIWETISALGSSPGNVDDYATDLQPAPSVLLTLCPPALPHQPLPRTRHCLHPCFPIACRKMARGTAPHACAHCVGP